MSKNGCFRASQSGDVGKRQKLGRKRKVIKEQERWGTGTRNRPIIIHDRCVRDCLHSTGVATLLVNNYLSSSGVATLLGTVLRFRDSNPT